MNENVFQLEAENILEVLKAVAECVPGASGEEVSMSAVQPEASAEALTAAVAINGGWKGTVMVEYSPRIASRIASAMFGLSYVSEDDVKDAIGEVAQIVSGNLKAFVAHKTGAECQLSLPVVELTERATSMLGCRHRAEFTWAGEPIAVRICPVVWPQNDSRRQLKPEVHS